MTLRTHKKVDSKGREEEWSWEETPEVVACSETTSRHYHACKQSEDGRTEMTVKVTLLKSGEDVIADIEEMVVGEKVVGYYFNYPCSVKLLGNEPVKDRQKSPFKLRITPWAPLAKDQRIPVALTG